MAISTGLHGFVGLSTDTKPLPATVQSSNSRAAGYLPAPKQGDKFVETDTLNVYTYVGDQGPQSWQLTV